MASASYSPKDKDVDICQPDRCPDQSRGPPTLDLLRCGPNGLIRCGLIEKYPTQRTCTCPGDQVCVEESTYNTWVEGSRFSGICMGRFCDDKSSTPKEQRQCHSSQLCVRKAWVEGSVKGRCLSRPCRELGRTCQAGWSCIEDASTGLGWCSYDGFASW
jgi:hypothetical protein